MILFKYLRTHDGTYALKTSWLQVLNGEAIHSLSCKSGLHRGRVVPLSQMTTWKQRGIIIKSSVDKWLHQNLSPHQSGWKPPVASPVHVEKCPPFPEQLQRPTPAFHLVLWSFREESLCSFSSLPPGPGSSPPFSFCSPGGSLACTEDRAWGPAYAQPFWFV